ncbi:hypothetical protein V8E52_004572 [Russula decolorans]
MSRQPPPPPFFPEASHTKYTKTRKNVTGDSAYPQGGSAPGHVHPQQMPSPSGYPSQQYSSSQPSHTSSRRSTVPTTHAYDHASFSPHPSAPPPSSGSTSYNPSFPIATVPARHSSTNPSGPPPPAESSISNRTVTMPMPVYSNTASSMPYDTRPQNTMPSSSQPGIRGGPQSSAQDYSYLLATKISNIAEKERATQVIIRGRGHHQTPLPLGDNRVGTEATLDSQDLHNPKDFAAQYVEGIPALVLHRRAPGAVAVSGVYNTTKIITSPVNVSTVLTWRACIRGL